MTLPPLPEVNYLGDDVSYGYDACDMREYGAACAAAERERIIEACIDIVAMHGGSVEIEAAIRAQD